MNLLNLLNLFMKQYNNLVKNTVGLDIILSLCV